MRRARKGPLREMIHRKILDAILAGRLNAGEKLLESQLAEKYKVSRTPVREALLQLEREGYLTHTKNVGAVVSRVPVRTVKEIYEVVAILEGYSTEIAINEGMSKKEISYLMDLQKEMEKAVKNREYEKYVPKNMAFHSFFLNRAKNAILKQTVEDLRMRIYRLVVEGLTLPKHSEEYLKDHKGIIEAARKGRSVEAAKLMKTHVSKARKNLSEKMEFTPY